MRIRTVLEAQKLPFDVIDVAQDDDALERMREIVGDEEALAPQIVNGEEYCGVCYSFNLYNIKSSTVLSPYFRFKIKKKTFSQHLLCFYSTIKII